VDEAGTAIARSSSCAVFIGPHDLGAWECLEVGVALHRAAADPTFRVFPVLLPGLEPFESGLLPPFLRTRTWVDFRQGVDSARALQDLIHAVRGLPFGPAVAIAPHDDVCPYLGLRTFEERDAGFFFGRDGDVQRLLEKLRAARMLAVVGPSGSGNSSVVRAGLVAAIHAGALPGSERWPLAVMRPGADPLAALAALLLSLSGSAAMTATVDALAGDARTLHLAVELALRGRPSGERVVVVVDQLEEAFTLCRDQAARQAMFGALVYAATVPGGRTIVVVTLRADFYARLAAFPELAQEASAHHALIGPPDVAALREVIEQPALRVELRLESGLVASILAEVDEQPGVLPLLQQALLETWRRQHERVDGALHLQAARRRRADHREGHLHGGLQAGDRRLIGRNLPLEAAHLGRLLRRHS
jgi:hypothetical protein